MVARLWRSHFAAADKDVNLEHGTGKLYSGTAHSNLLRKEWTQ
jgi:hypothetical protein